MARPWSARRRCGAAIAASVALSACTDDTFLAVPTDVAAWIAADRSEASEPYRFRLLVPKPGAPLLELELEASNSLVLLGLSSVPPLAVGPDDTVRLVRRSSPDPTLVALPTPSPVLELDVSGPTLRTLADAPRELSDLAYVDPTSDECPTFREVEVEAGVLTTITQDEQAVFGWVRSPTETILGTGLGLFVVERRSSRNIYPRPLSGGGQSEDGRTFVASGEGVDEVVLTSTLGVRRRRVADFSTLADQLPAGISYAPRWVVPHANGDIHAMDIFGILTVWRGGRWTVLAIPPPPLGPSARRFLARLRPDDDEVVAGTFSDPTYLRGRGAELRAVVTPDFGYGGVSGVVTHPRGGLIIVTSRGVLLDERTDYQPAPGAAAYSGLLFHVAIPFRGGVLVGGDTGAYGFMTASRTLCRPPVPVQTSIRVALPLGDGLLLSGRAKDVAPDQLTIHRIEVR
jgi:hypothetical protein